MPEHIYTTVDGESATIQAAPGGDLAAIIRTLMEHTSRARDVRTTTSLSGGLALRVPLDLARRSGLLDEPDSIPVPVAVPPLTKLPDPAVVQAVPETVKPVAPETPAQTVQTPEPVTEPAPVVQSEPAEQPAKMTVPPRSGTGSGGDVWRAFLTQEAVDYPADADRDDLFALWDAETARRAAVTTAAEAAAAQAADTESGTGQ